MRDMPLDHVATVVLNPDGSLSSKSSQINMSVSSNGSSRKLVSVIPDITDTIVSIHDYPDYFENLSSLNVSLTNACNLSCSYCYEQHNKDFGRFTVESIKKAYDFIVKINNQPEKNLIFFGGEPLIHAKLILDFLNTHREEISNNANVRISIVTNGLLLTHTFVEQFFSFPNTQIIMSLDTLDATIDKRGLTQPQLDNLCAKIKSLPGDILQAGRLIVRPTISFAAAKTLPTFLRTLYDLGVRSFILQPLIMGNVEGFLDWKDDDWKNLTNSITEFVLNHPEINIEVTEGVGKRSTGSNCLTGYDIISIDPSGDFSGCFFFVNQKVKAGSLISGNIFQEVFYINREQMFADQYKNMFLTNEECQKCSLQDHCYQCPAGNLDLKGKLYSPDTMCKRFVQFYLDIRDLRFKQQWKQNIDKITNDMNNGISLETILGNFIAFCIPGFDTTDLSMVQIRNSACIKLGSTENEHNWNELHNLLMKKFSATSIRMDEKKIENGGIVLFVALLKTIFA